MHEANGSNFGVLVTLILVDMDIQNNSPDTRVSTVHFNPAQLLMVAYVLEGKQDRGDVWVTHL